MLFRSTILFPVIGSILSGAVLGDHISPISDTTIMTSTSTGSHHMDHVKTQFFYALPVLISSLFGFLIAGLSAPYGIASSSISALLASIIITFILLFSLDKTKTQREKTAQNNEK